MKLYMIRHGETKGNQEHRYVGCTDEGLLPEAAERLKSQNLPGADRVFVSPMRRCRETAKLLYPGSDLTVVEAFRECDFGAFEYCNYTELNGNPGYQRFIDSMGACGFPGGEDLKTFQRRCTEGFERIMGEMGDCVSTAALVVHGGTIMALLDRFSDPHRDYYDWQTGNGHGYYMDAVTGGEGGREVKLFNITPWK